MSVKEVTILLVGKPGNIRKALGSLFQALPGFKKLISVDTASKAAEIFETLEPNLVVIAGGLPELDVLELVRQLKGKHPETHILVFTERTEQRQLALRVGADHVLPNGLPIGKIFLAVKDILN